jgi:hypothetical protein
MKNIFPLMKWSLVDGISVMVETLKWVDGQERTLSISEQRWALPLRPQRIIGTLDPLRSKSPIKWKAENMAMKLVGERHEKRDLVNLVRWLIMDKAEKANGDIK